MTVHTIYYLTQTLDLVLSYSLTSQYRYATQYKTGHLSLVYIYQGVTTMLKMTETILEKCADVTKL